MLKSVRENKKEKLVFQVFFLKNDEDQSVEVEEVEEIDFEEVKNGLNLGNLRL